MRESVAPQLAECYSVRTILSIVTDYETDFFIALGLEYAAVCDKSLRSLVLAGAVTADGSSEGVSTQRSRSLQLLLNLVALDPNITTRQSGLDNLTK